MLGEHLENKMITIELRLGDVIKITTEKSGFDQYYIEYIDRTKIKSIHVETLEKVDFTIDEEYELIYNGVKINGQIALIYRNKEEGFARQNDLLVNTWISIQFNDDTTNIIGQIIELPENTDMITVLTYPQKETLYFNFAYKGKLEEIRLIKIISSPYTESEYFEMVPEKEEEGITMNIDRDTYRSPEIFEIGEMVPLGKIEDIVYLVNADETRYRYDIDTQKTDLLNDMLSKLPKSQRTIEEFAKIHLIIERFRQLRQQFSVFDQYGNITNYIQKGAKWKPLVENLKTFQRMLYWIIPVVTQTKIAHFKKEEEEENEEEEADTILAPTEDQLDMIIDRIDPDDELNTIIQEFKRTNATDNKYIKLIQQLYKYYKPFQHNIQKSQTLTHLPVLTPNMNVIINNDNTFQSNVVDVFVKSTKGKKTTMYNILPRRYINGMYLGGDKVLYASKITSDIRMTITREPVNNTTDQMDLVSILTLPEPVIHFTKVNLPGTTILERAELGVSFIQFHL